MHRLFNATLRSMLVGGLTLALVFYCINNAYWSLPHTDFRPFKEGVNIRERKQLEEESEANREVISYTLRNRLTGKYVVLPYQQYLSEYKLYPKTDWEVVETTMTEPEVPETKISDFVIYGPNEDDVTEQILTNPDPFIMLVCQKLYHHGSRQESVEVIDSIQVPVDTVVVAGDTVVNYRTETRSRQETRTIYQWDQSYLDRFKEVVVPFTQNAAGMNVKSLIVIGGADSRMIEDFKKAAGIEFTGCSADDILLKTIIRSNPGILLMQDGQILAKWHYRHLPSFPEVKSTYIK